MIYKKFLKNNLEIKLNGNLENSLPNILNITIPKIPSDLFFIELSMKGIYVSEKKCLQNWRKKNSHVIVACIKIKKDLSSLRFHWVEKLKRRFKFCNKTINHILKIKDW